MKITDEKRDYLEDLIVSYNMLQYAESQVEENCVALKAMGITDEELELFKVKEIYYGNVDEKTK